MERKHWELSQLLKAVEKKLNDESLKPAVLKKIAAHIKGTGKPKRETLDKISLLAGFQDWESFKAAIHGDADGLSNFEDDAADKQPASQDKPAEH